MRGDHHEAGLVRAGIDLQVLGDADKPGVVVAPVLNVGSQPLQAVKLNAAVGADGGHVGPLGLSHSLGGSGGVGAGGDLHALELFQIGAALADGLGMGEDLLHILQLGAPLGHQVVVHLQPGGPDDLELVVQHKVIYLGDGTGGAVFQREHAVLAEAVLHGGKDTLKAAEVHHLGVFEELSTGQLGVGPFHALAGNGGLGGEQVGGGGHGPLDLLPQGGRLGVQGTLVAPADLKEHGPQSIAVLLQLRGKLGGDVRQLLPLPGHVQHR